MRYLALAFITAASVYPSIAAAGPSGDVGFSEKLPPWGSHVVFGEDTRDVATVTSAKLPPWGSHPSNGQDAVEPVATEEVVVVEDVVVVPEVIAIEEVGAADGRCQAVATSPGAVGNPCETTRSFMASMGMTEHQIQSVETIHNTAH